MISAQQQLEQTGLQNWKWPDGLAYAIQRVMAQ